MRTSADLTTGFSVLRLSIDPLRGVSIPVGAVVWDADRKWYKVRVIHSAEQVVGITPERRMLVEHTERQLNRWAHRQVIPYKEVVAEPWSSGFWEGVQSVLTTGVQLDAPKAMEALASPDDIDLLFEAVVQPNERPTRTRARVEGALRRALGRDVERVFKARLPVLAFENAREHVLRGAHGDDGIVVVEAVNLAGKNARRDADALVSRLNRIREGVGRDQQMRTIVGYTASPGGLNGEGHMKDWIEIQVTRDVYDMSREAEDMRAATVAALVDVGVQQEKLL